MATGVTGRGPPGANGAGGSAQGNRVRCVGGRAVGEIAVAAIAISSAHNALRVPEGTTREHLCEAFIRWGAFCSVGAFGGESMRSAGRDCGMDFVFAAARM